MKPINVMVTGVGGGGVGEQIMKCLAMSNLSLRVIGCDMNIISRGLKMADKAYVVPPAYARNYVDVIIKICKQNDVKILFHGSEPELKVISNNRKIFEDNGIIVPLNPKHVIDVCMDKTKTMEFLKQNGFPTQKYWEICSKEDLIKIDYFPVVLKPSIGGGGSINSFIIQNSKELQMFGEYLLGIYDKFIVQEYVGCADTEYTAGVICNKDGKYINSIAVKKSILSGLSNKTRITNQTDHKELGDILAISSGVSQGEIGRFEEVTAPARRIAESLGATASINIQCRIHKNSVYVFEINPRISGTSSLRALVGYNEPEIFIKERVLGEEIKCDFEYKSGFIVRGLSETYIDEFFMKNNVKDMSGF